MKCTSHMNYVADICSMLINNFILFLTYKDLCIWEMMIKGYINGKWDLSKTLLLSFKLQSK